MDEHTAISPGTNRTAGSRSHDYRWVIVAVIDPTAVNPKLLANLSPGVVD